MSLLNTLRNLFKSHSVAEEHEEDAFLPKKAPEEATAEEYETDDIRAKLRVAINSEIAVRKAVLKFRQSVAHYEEKQTKLLHYNDTLAKSLQHFSGIDDAEKRKKIQTMMDEEIPQSLAVLAASISGTKVRLQKLQVELEALARAREQAETAYRATLKDDTEFDFEEDDTADKVPAQDNAGASEDELGPDDDLNLSVEDSSDSEYSIGNEISEGSNAEELEEFEEEEEGEEEEGDAV